MVLCLEALHRDNERDGDNANGKMMMGKISDRGKCNKENKGK